MTPEDRLEQNERADRGRDVHPRHDVQDRAPRSRRLGDKIADWHEQRGNTLRTIEDAVDAANILGAEGVTRRGAEQAVDFAPGEENQTTQEDEGPRIRAKRGQRDDAATFEHEGHEHRVLAPDMIGDPAEERPRYAVHDPVEQ